MAFFVLESLLLPFNPSSPSPGADPTPIPLHLSLPLFTLLVDHLLKLVEGATLMDPQRWRRALDLPPLLVTAVSRRQARSLRVKDVKRLVTQHVCAHVELALMGIISSAEGGMLAMAADTLGAIMMGVLRVIEQFDLPFPLPLSSCRPLVDNPSLIIRAIRAANALPDHDTELPPAVYPTMLACLTIAARLGDIGPGHRVVEAVCQLLAEPVGPTLVDCVVKLLQWMIGCGDELVTKGKATSNPFVDQIVQCEAVQQLRGRRDPSAKILSLIDSLPKTANSDSSSAASGRLRRPVKAKTPTDTHHASGPPSPPHPSTSSGGLDGLVDGLFSDDIDTFTAAVKDVAGCLRTSVAKSSVKRLVMRFAKERTAFRRFLMRLVDSSGVEYQVAIADVLFCFVHSGFLERMTPSDRLSAIQDIFEILTWEHLSSDGGVGADLGGEVDSVITSAIVKASSGDEPLPGAIDVVTYARLRLIEYALHAATALEAAGGPELRASFLQTHQTTLRQVMDVIREFRHRVVANEAVAMLKELFAPTPFGPSFQLVLEFVSIFVEGLKRLDDDETEGKLTEGTSHFISALVSAAYYLLNSPRKGIVTEWPAIRAALDTHVYAHIDTLLTLIAASSPSSRLCSVATPTVGALLHTALVLCMRKRKGGGPVPVAHHRFVLVDAIEQNGVGKITAAAPLPMQSLRRLLLDAAMRDKVLSALGMDHIVDDEMTISFGLFTATALLIPAIAMIDGGETGLLIESGFMSTLISLLGSAERIGRPLLALSMDCLKKLSQRDRKVLGTDGLAKPICDMLLKDARGRLNERAGVPDSERKTAVDILKSIVSYGKSVVAKGAPNPIVGQILQFESVKAMRNPRSGIEVSRQKDTKAQPKTAISAAELAAQDAKAKRMQEALLAQERRENEAKDKKAKGKRNKGGKGHHQQHQQDAAGGDAASPSDVVIEPSVPSTAASTSRASAADEVEASQPEPSSSIADTSGAPGVPSVSATAGSDRPGDGGGAAESAAGGSDADGSDDEDGDAMLLNSAFGQHARQQRNEGHKKKTKGKHATRPTPTPTPQPSQPPRPSLNPTLRANRTGQTGRFAPAANEDRYRGGRGPIRMPAAIPLSSAQFPKGRVKMSPGNGGMAPPLPKRPSVPRPLLSDDDSPSGSASPPCGPVGGRGAGRGLMTIFAHQTPPPPSLPYRLPSAEELRTGPSLQQHRQSGQDDQQQPTRDGWPSLSTAGPSMSGFFANAPVGPAPPAGGGAGGRGGGGLSADPFYDDSGGDVMYCVPPPPAFPPPPQPHPPIDPSSFHPIGSPLPVSYNGGPQASGFPPHPLGIHQPFPSSPTPAAAAANGGGGLSANPFYDDSGADDMYVPPPPPIFDYEEEEGYQPPSSSNAPDPFAAAGAMHGGNGGPSTGFGAMMMGGGASGSEQLVDQLCRQLEQKDQEAKRRAREVQEAREKAQEARRSEEAMIRRLQEAEWQLAKIAAQQSSRQYQPPSCSSSSSSSSSAPQRPSSSATHANTTMQHQQHGDGDDGPACVICFGEHGPASVMYIPCRHMHICTKCYADRRRAWRQNLPRVRAANARRVEVNKEIIKEDKEPMAMLPEGYLCEQCQTEVAFAGSVSEVAQWSTKPFVTGAS
ncbi:unnamed protein product [Vitrella brassicaformis CCMP3155]|uniref:Uncharacterized protein n=1 Tax=Vitrella brassicaformis (strain CCMP3155) TaxID=1169540 RepID=A0A0G4GKM0_VITBC|nr:unnamed protein product [Vitrella brassicaformis CCMP3155]|eukprot:CEM30557.1 unnamed protein product [Vitrella brassicaformis CCMP3155]